MGYIILTWSPWKASEDAVTFVGAREWLVWCMRSVFLACTFGVYGTFEVNPPFP